MLIFISTVTILAFIPGPDNIFVLTQSIVSGRSAGLKITLGLCTGLIFHTIVVALGISVIFQTSLIAFNILKYLGVFYLLYLALMSFKASSSKLETSGKTELTSFQLYRRGIIMNITNPKVSIFFMAFLPQFTNSNNGSITTQLITLGFLVILVSLVVFTLITQLAGIIGELLSKYEKGESFLNKLAGTVFSSLAVKLIFTKQSWFAVFIKKNQPRMNRIFTNKNIV